ACTGGTPNCSNAIATANQFGLLVEPSSPNPPFSSTTPAFQTTTGYDLSTGLGTLNVNNLVTGWMTFNTALKGTTTLLTSPSGTSITITHGNSVTFTATVASTMGTPTGTASLFTDRNPNSANSAGTKLAEGVFALTAGSGTLMTNTLPGGGPYNVFATYP